MTIGPAALSHLVSEIYETAMRPEAWSSVMQSTAKLLSSSVGVLLAQDVATRAYAFSAVSPDTPAKLLDEYASYYGPRDRMRNTVLQAADIVHVEDTLLSAGERSRDEVYNDCYIRYGMTHAIGWSMRAEPFEATVVFGRSSSGPPFDAEEMSVCQLLIPHFGRALAIRTRLGGIELQRDAAFDAVELVKRGVVFLSLNGTVLFMNASARSITTAGDGLITSRGRLSAEGHQESGRLHTLVAKACAGTRTGGSMTVSRSNGKPPHSVFVSSLSRHGETSATDPAAIVLISDPAAAHGDGRSLHGYRGLTPAEAEIAAALCEGKSLEEIADERCISKSTARTHLKHVFAKTATKRQGELVAMLLRGPLGVDALP